MGHGRNVVPQTAKRVRRALSDRSGPLPQHIQTEVPKFLFTSNKKTSQRLAHNLGNRRGADGKNPRLVREKRVRRVRKGGGRNIVESEVGGSHSKKTSQGTDLPPDNHNRCAAAHWGIKSVQKKNSAYHKPECEALKKKKKKVPDPDIGKLGERLGQNT